MNIVSIKTLVILVVIFIAACGESNDNNSQLASTGFDDAAAIKNMTDNLIVAKYNELADSADSLAESVVTLKSDRTAANLEAAKEAWRATRVPWEQTEAFIFGPVDANGYDPALDSWPVNRTDLQGVLDGDDIINIDFVSKLADEQKGFHTIEFLLFGGANDKIVSDLTDRELEYAVAATAVLASVAGDLRDSWTIGINGNPAYAPIFGEPGTGNTKYPSVSASGQEVVNGIVGISDEVANGKIGDPFTKKDVTAVESQFSFNSLSDFKDNIVSAESAYNLALADFIKSKDAALHTRIEAEFATAFSTLAEIKEPFRDAITDDGEAKDIQAAVEAINAINRTFDGDVLQLVTGI